MKITWFILLIAILTCSCVEYPEYPNEPSIEFIEAIPYFANDTLGNLEKNIQLKFTLYDGVGDIGHTQQSPNARDFFSEFFVKKNGNFHPISDFVADTSNYIIPQLRANNDDKFVKAEVTIDIPHTANTFPFDTVYFTFYVIDRAGNKSNTDSSNVLIW